MPSLRELTRTRVIGALERLAAPGVHTALLLDNHTRRVLSSVCRMSEVMEAGQLTLVDNVHTQPSERSPAGLRSHMRVIYLVSPTASSIAAIVDDYQEAPIYGGACHILLSRRLPTEMLQELRDCSLLMRHVQTLRELNIGAVSLQTWRREGEGELTGGAFSLDEPGALATLYGPALADGEDRGAVLARLAEQAAALCAGLGERAPQLRVHAHAHPVCRAFGEALARELDRMAPAAEAGGAASSCCVLVVERGFDALTPLLHDFGFEALAEGLGHLRDGRFTRPAATVGAPVSEALLSDTDPVWRALRHLPLADVSAALSAQLEAFLQDESHALILKAQRGEALSASELRKVARAATEVGYNTRVRQLKQQRELLSAVTSSLLGAAEPSRAKGDEASAGAGASKTPLYAQLLLEQDLAVGRDEARQELRPRDASARARAAFAALGHAPLLPKVAPPPPAPVSRGYAAAEAGAGAEEAEEAEALSRGEAEAAEAAASAAAATREADEKARLLAVYASCVACDDSTREALLQLAQLAPAAFLPVAQGLFRLGCRAQPAAAAAAAAASSRTAAAASLGPRRLAPAAPRDGLSDMPLARHTPRLAAILRAALASSLSLEDFPYLRGEPPPQGSFAAAAATGDAEYAPSALGSWAYHGRGERARPGAASRHKRKLVVLVLGGACHAELRCARELSEKHGAEVYFGSTAVHTPLQFVRALADMPAGPPLAMF